MGIESNSLKRIWVELPESLGGMIEWINPYQHTAIPEGNVSLATILDGIATAVREDVAPLWSGENGRADQEMVLAARRSIRENQQPIALPLLPDQSEEETFDRNFEQRFGVHPREDLDKALSVNFKAR